jgi:hypothetical protein
MNRPKTNRPIFGKILILVCFGAVLFYGTAGAQAQTPVISGLFPSSVRAGSAAFTLNVLGTQFVSGAVVYWGGSARLTSAFSSSTLEAQISASDITTPGTIQITVVNPGGVVSNAVTFTILTANPVPVISSLTPSRVLAGGPAFDLVVHGQLFTAQSVVRWNGSDRTTTFQDSGTLTAQIPAADIANAGTATITVFDNAPGGSSSGPLTFTISQYSNLYFPQVAVDGGYTTVITLMNNGTETDSGFITLTDQLGNPFIVSGSMPPNAPLTAAAFPISVPGGGVRILTLTVADTAGPTPKSGWARVDSLKGLLNGVATFQTKQGTLLTSIAGVLPAAPLNSVAIPIDNDASVGRRTGFAVANPGANDVNLQILVVDPDGFRMGLPISVPIGARKQIATFLDQIAAQYLTFKGTMILYGQSPGDELVSVALLVSQGPTSSGLSSVIPAISVTRPGLQ